MRGIIHAEDFGWSAAPRGGSGGGGSQMSYQQTILPDWVNANSQSNYQMAQNIAATPYTENPDIQVAGFTPDQLQAQQQVRDLQGQGQGTYQSSIDAITGGGLLGNVAPITTDQVNANTAALFNPYTLATVAPTVAQMRDSLGASMRGIGSNASQVGAFGGSRQGIEEGTAISKENIGEGQLVGGLLQSGYNTAQQQAMDLGKTNLSAGEWAATAAPQLATAQSNLAASQAGLLGQVGSQEQQQEQTGYDTAAALWQQQHDYPLEQLDILQQSLQNSPYGTTTIGKGSAPQSGSAAGTAIGAIGTAASIAAIAL